MKYKVIKDTVEAVQYHLREYSDNPMVFDEVPEWLDDAVKQGIIRAEFKSEDYWYLIVYRPQPELAQKAGPGDWIVKDGRGIGVVKCEDFLSLYKPV